MNLPLQQPIMQPGNEHGGANPALWMQGSSPWMLSCHGIDHMGELAMPKMDNLEADGTLHAIINDSVHSVDVPLQNPNFQDHEMFSWLHFDDVIDKGFCTDIFRDLPCSNVQIVKHSFNQIGLQQEASSLHATEALLNELLPPNPVFSSHSICPSISQAAIEVVDSCSSCPNDTKDMVAGADAAMVVDGGRVNTSRCGLEPFNELQASGRLPLPVDDCMQAVVSIVKRKSSDMVPLSNPNPSPMDLSQHHFPSMSQGSTLPPIIRPPDVSLCTTQASLHRNFAHFSSPVAETRANLHAVSASSGPTSIERARQPQAGKVNSNAIKQPCQRELVSMEIDTRHAPLPSQPLPAASRSIDTGETTRGKSIGEENLVSSHFSNSALTASNRAMEKLHRMEQTATSPSRGSASSSEKSGKEAATASFKRRFSGLDDSEYQSEDLEETTNNSKKSVKRSRAAEMHNLCERKRRDRINEKLLALRDLMPNSSKTAKASILDEAIEYVKLLQSQLQAWSARTGICIPPALIPSMGMQHIQMPALPHMGLGMGVGMGVGLGMGMGMGMGMGLIDVNAAAAAAAAGRTMMPLPPYPAPPSTLPSHSMNGLQPCLPAMNIVDGQEHLQSHHMLDPYHMYVPHHQAQASPMNLTMYRNMELYNAYVQGQQHQWQQLQQQHQWQLLQQQQLQGHWSGVCRSNQREAHMRWDQCSHPIIL